MLNVIIAEDNLQISVHLSNMINSKNVRCIGILNDGTKVYQRIKETNPDVLILDLKMPGKNGLEILEEIEKDQEIKTRIVVYSGEMSYMSLARKYKCVERFFSKMTPAEEIGRELEMIADEALNKNLESQIKDMLFELGFTYSLKGTRLMSECILYSVLNNEDNINNVYDKIAKKHNENANTIKSDIHTAIKNMWRYTDRPNAKKILRLSDYDKPSSKGVISMIKYYVEN